MPRTSKQQARYAVGQCLMLWSSNDATQQCSRPKTKLGLKPTPMSINAIDLATLITAIAGLATALVALWNVRELRLMREVSSSPVLIAENDRFAVLCGGKDEAYLPAGYIPAVPVANFGNGPALNAYAIWDIQDDELIQVLRAYDPHDNYKIGFEKSPFADDPCLRLYWNHFVTRQLREELNPIVPFKTNEKVRVKLPPYYLQAFHLYVALAVHARSDRKTYFQIRAFPTASLEISYRDLSNNRISRRYKVTLVYEHNATHALNNDDAFACALYVSPQDGNDA